MGATLTPGASTSTRVAADRIPAEPGAPAYEGAGAEPAGGESSFAPERLGYLPALDGLRGVGLLTVMAFHAGFPIASGGPLTVSMFFTLSGFLIASLALEERARTGRLSLARFWERRVRRLLPAALVTLGAIVGLQWAFEIGSGSAFRNDVLAALGYGTNWRLVAQGDDYANLFAAPSPLTHLWSLAIEEQFYLLFPLLFVGVMALTRARPLRAGLAFAGIAAASFVVAAWSAGRYGNSGLTYYGTHTRAGEILFGVVVAFLFANRRVRAVLRSPLGSPILRYGAVGALALMLALWSFMTLASPSLFQGVTIVNAICTSWVALASVESRSPVNALLGNWPLRTLGKVSYAGYLAHWPLFILLDEQRVGVAGWALFGVRVAATVAVAGASYWVVEYPFRRRLKSLRLPRLGGLMAVGAAAVTVAVLVVPVHASEDVEFDLSQAQDFDGEEYRFHVREEGVVMPQDGAASVADVLLLGDSVSWSLLPGLTAWNQDNPDANITVDSHMAFGCPLSGPGQWIGPSGLTNTWPDCDSWFPDLPLAFARSQPDVIAIVMGLGDIGGRDFFGTWREFGDPQFDEWFTAQVDRVADTLATSGAEVVWLTYPDVRIANPEDPTADPADMAINDPERIDRLNEVIREQVGGRDGFRVAELNSWVREWPGGQFQRHLRDGVHFTMRGSVYAGTFVAPEIVAAARGEESPEPPTEDPPGP